MNIFIVAGARPNFMKISPILKELKNYKKNNNIKYYLVHTGQHYDYNMSGSFFDQLKIPKPDIFLNAGSGTQSEQTASIMVSFEKVLIHHKPKLVIVVGDVNSTMACAISAKKLNISVAHVEAGIRSYDMKMPEEINRLVTDSIADYFFTTTQEASNNLLSANVSKSKIFHVGNTMIDTLLHNINNSIKPSFLENLSINNFEFFTLTLHRPSNVDNLEKLINRLTLIQKCTKGYKTIFPVHPRTKKILQKSEYTFKNIIFIDPLPYFQFIYLIKNSKGIITDSGGITEEATVLNIPCLTLRNSTERPETVSLGTNVLVGDDDLKFQEMLEKILENNWKKSTIPDLWDGKTSLRIVKTLIDLKYI
tara:strand:- start:2401 stop:3492 length:1092 start_codon:yes stop_codon:yes gene_type:complete